MGYFRRDPMGESVWDMRTWDNLYETLLRAKANMVIPGTSPNPDERHIALANRRGTSCRHNGGTNRGVGQLPGFVGSSFTRTEGPHGGVTHRTCRWAH